MRNFINGMIRKLKIQIWCLFEKMLGFPQYKKENRNQNLIDKPRVLIVGRNYSSNLCMARSFGIAGYNVEVIRVFAHKQKMLGFLKQLIPDAYSKYVQSFSITSKYRLVHHLISSKLSNRKTLLIPTDDMSCSIVDEHYDVLSEFYLIPNIKGIQGNINNLMNKEKQNILAIQAGLPVVSSCVITTENGEFEIPKSVNFPCFIKPNISKNGSKKGMRRCDTEEELKEAIALCCEKKDVEMIVEDYIDIAREMSILGVSTKHGVIAAGLFAATKGGHNGRRGVAFTGEVLDADLYRDLIDKIIAFVQTLDYEGLFDVDLIEGKDGKVYFVELNLRYGGSGYAIVESGINLPGMFADYMLQGKELDYSCRLENVGKTFISEKIGWEEVVDHCMNYSDFLNEIEKADIHFIKNEKDNKPYQHFQRVCKLVLKYKRMN